MLEAEAADHAARQLWSKAQEEADTLTRAVKAITDSGVQAGGRTGRRVIGFAKYEC